MGIEGKAGVQFMGDWAKLSRFEAHDGEGKLEVSGGLGFEGWVPRRARLALRATALPLSQEGVDLAWATGSAKLEAALGQERATTAVQIGSLDLRLPNRINRSLQPLEPHPDVVLTNAPKNEEALDPYVMAFVFKSRQPLHVHRDDFDTEVNTELAVEIQDPELRVGGFIGFERGEFETLGKEFRILRGGMRFDGETDLNPDVNLVATHRPLGGGTAPVQVTVLGKLSNPEITFSSEDCPGDAGAISMLLSGRCPSDEEPGSGQTGRTEQAFAAGLVGGILTLGAQQELGRLLPRIAVESTGEGYGTRVRAGIEADDLIPEFMRALVQRVYVQGAISTQDDQAASNTGQSSQNSTLDLLIELYFPNNLVGAGRFAEGAWGVELTWEP